MTDALTITEISMANDMQRMRSISHNLANVSTPGFKREIIVQRTFQDMLNVNQAGINNSRTNYPVGIPQIETMVDHQPGSLKFTGNSLDIAIEGNGYLEVSTDDGTAYTRRGNLRLDSAGQLVTDKGYVVNLVEGSARLTSTQPVINEAGEIREGDRRIGKLKIVEFDNTKDLISLGDGLYRPGESTSLQTVENARVRQGFQETGNVGMTIETVRMIETVRHFEASQKVIHAYDSLMDTSIRILGDF